MNYTNLAIKKMVEGGWKFPRWGLKDLQLEVEGQYIGTWSNDEGGPGYDKIRIEVVLLDPLAWQALGKALGWSGRIRARYYTQLATEYVKNPLDVPQWGFQMLKFTHHLIEGKSIESYFQELLTPSNK